ncbi:hypothetical protein [Paraburkholderia tagetis]|uniref:Uncharacterized protein n=1 Tax=Paraburkholderia tagetis TaxID=2913261 RepID=A0A9X1ZZX2_9BURK|nr:hypothetical protein [Paraburkholderia tagetis]MCG5079098.1 hypothetical protein [Paraburkholderia tagetis]
MTNLFDGESCPTGHQFFASVSELTTLDNLISISMTITIVLFADTFPVVITDTLLASPSDFVKAPVALPTIVRPVEMDFEVQTDSGPMKISDLSQKIHPLGRRGMFAYSGRELFARSVANGISARLSKGAGLSEALVRSELYALTEAQRESIAFAIVYDTEDGKRFQYHHRMQTFKSSVFGEVFFTGSGEKNLSELLAQLGSPQSPMGGQIPPPVGTSKSPT